ncbi:cardiolipin synthase [Bacillus carboniphilus]|uniref:Cardiolipin synthase n=1 Tax=Bacillus carboniphilus TaxID=86663 RepID=A0ABY9JTB0_9BACI|nr:cardiolipin synthase [Bacillus carboniphilus]WLR41743.1 cardiolipin synthase [Bacillus carboniphilus]
MLLLIATFLILLLLYFELVIGMKNMTNNNKSIVFPLRKSEVIFFDEGKSFYDSLFNDIQSAKQSIHILFFIVKNDQISNTFFNLLIEKANSGIEVVLLLDFVGSFSLKKKTVNTLRSNGVNVAFANFPSFPFFFNSLQRRNHRKITIIDGKIGYHGGFNIGDEYIGKNPELGFWRDYHLRLTGEGVLDLQAQFSKDWDLATGDKVLYHNRPLLKGETLLQFLSTTGIGIEEQFLNLIRQAKEELIIGSPYFVPSKQLLYELQSAIERGVIVKVIVPLREDHPLVKQASYPYLQSLLVVGGEIWEYYQGFYHSKVFIVDHIVCDIGTANFDKRSLYLNEEMNCFIYDPSFITLVKKSIQNDLNECVELTIKELQKRRKKEFWKEWIARLISPFL